MALANTAVTTPQTNERLCQATATEMPATRTAGDSISVTSFARRPAASRGGDCVGVVVGLNAEALSIVGWLMSDRARRQRPAVRLLLARHDRREPVEDLAGAGIAGAVVAFDPGADLGGQELRLAFLGVVVHGATEHAQHHRRVEQL